jgi:hypothetical protein
MDKNILIRDIDKVLLANTNYIPQLEREKLIQKIIDIIPKNKDIKWTKVLKSFKTIIEDNKESTLCQAFCCVNYIKKIIGI